MKKENTLILEYTLLFVVVLAAFMFFLHMRNQEVNLCRYVFSGLVKGSYGVQRFIDWENLQALDVDVAATYNNLANDKEKVNYKKSFIKNFSVGFKQGGGRLKSFTHWRIYDRDREKTVVAADYRNKIILFTLSKYGRRLIALQWG